MDAGPDLLTLEQIGKYNAMCERGEITKEKMEFYKHNACPSCGACSFMGTASTMQVMAEALGKMEFYKHNACPSCGACSFMGTASTMQVMAEALGLMLPGRALMPATSKDLREFAKKAGKQAVWLAEQSILRSLLVHGNSIHNAGNGRSAGTDAPGKCPDAGNQQGLKGVCKKSRKTGSLAGRAYPDTGQDRIDEVHCKCIHGTCGNFRFYQLSVTYSGKCQGIWN